MGAIFLYKKEEQIDVENAKVEFSNKGFGDNKEFSLGEWIILTYEKIVTRYANYYFYEGDAVFSVGTPIYKNLNYADTLIYLLLDFKNDKLDSEKLFGHYNLVFYTKGNISVLCDSLNVKHLYTDVQHRFYTSSFLVAAAAYKGKITLNRNAIYEKLLSGIIISPDTLLQEIIQLDNSIMDKINLENTGIRFINRPLNIERVEYHNSGKKLSVEHQGEILKSYFQKIKDSAVERGVDIGLSGGYDSRLLLAAAGQCYHNNLHSHTHSTGEGHNIEKQIAIELARIRDVSITVINTKNLDEPDVETDRILRENLYFFDGRTSFDIGGLSPTYTANYRIQATQGRGFTLTGVGGEVYRNSFSISGKKINMKRFLNDYVYYEFFDEAVLDDTLTKQIKDYHMEKAEKRLNINISGMTNMLTARRYYSEVMMPDGQGTVVDAYNQISSSVAPMLEPYIIKEAYKGLNYLGSSGGYEGAIIKYLDPALASVNSAYGYPFDKIPLKNKIKELIRAHIHMKMWKRLSKVKNSSSKYSNKEYLESICRKSLLLSDAMTYFKEMMPDIDYDVLLTGQSTVSNTAYMALLLYHWKGRLKNGE